MRKIREVLRWRYDLGLLQQTVWLLTGGSRLESHRDQRHLRHADLNEAALRRTHSRVAEPTVEVT